MKDLFLFMIFSCLGFISNVDIEIHEEITVYNLTSGETYNFYVPIKQLAEIFIEFQFEYFIYLPFNSIYINEYSNPNGTPIRNHIIDHLEYYKSEKYYYYSIDYFIEDFSTNYISFTIMPNSTIDNVEIGVYTYGGLYNMSNGVTESFQDIYYNVPLYLSIPITYNSMINIDLKVKPYDILENLILIEYQKNDSNYNIYEYKNYTFDYKVINNEKIISFNYLITNINTNFFAKNFNH